MFKKFILAAVFSIFAISAQAETTAIDTSGLNPAQIADIKRHAATVVANAASSAGAPKDVGALATMAATWGTQAAQAAEGFARAITIAARELGVTVNDFLHTDAGKLTAALIIWKVAGASIVSILYAMIFVTVGLTITRIIYVKLFTARYEPVEYSYIGGLFKGTKLVRVPKGFQELRNDGEWLAFWIMLIVCFGTLGIGAAMI